MENDDSKKEQLKAADALDEIGIDPDTIMVTYTPEEYSKMYEIKEQARYVLNGETIDSFPIELVGSTYVLMGHSFSVDAYANVYIPNFVAIYIDAVKKALERAYEGDFTALQIQSQIAIQKTIAESLQAALTFYKKEQAEELRAYNEAINTFQKMELGADLRLANAQVWQVESLINKNNSFINYLSALYFDMNVSR